MIYQMLILQVNTPNYYRWIAQKQSSTGNLHETSRMETKMKHGLLSKASDHPQSWITSKTSQYPYPNLKLENCWPLKLLTSSFSRFHYNPFSIQPKIHNILLAQLLRLTWRERIVRTNRTAPTTKYFSLRRVSSKILSITSFKRKLHLQTEKWDPC